jgi:23S rRNA-/tRNA-specific pseudouridylate synthase
MVAVFKPDQLPTKLPKDQRKHSLHTYLETALDQKIHMPSRLDVATSGLVLCSSSKVMNKYLQHQFQGGKKTNKHNKDINMQKRIRKDYLFASRTKWPFVAEEIVVNRSIGFQGDHPILRKCVPNDADEELKTSEAKSSLTVMRHLGTIEDSETKEKTTYVLATPITGRTHQIRLHAASVGMPICGDIFYGGAPHESLHLLAYRYSMFEVDDVYRTHAVPARLFPEWLPPWLESNIEPPERLKKRPPPPLTKQQERQQLRAKMRKTNRH